MSSGRDRRMAASSPRHGTDPAPPRKDRGARRRKMRRALAMLIDGDTVQHVAAAFEVSIPTVYQWMRDPEIAKALEEAEQEVVASARTRLRLRVHASITELEDIEATGGKEDGPRVKAIEIHLDRAGIVPQRELHLEITSPEAELSDDEIARRLAEIARGAT